jgi:hypothetical protein
LVRISTNALGESTRNTTAIPSPSPAIPTLAAGSGTWTLTGSLHVADADFTATLLPNGQVLVAGGLDSNYNYLTSAELYTP